MEIEQHVCLEILHFVKWFFLFLLKRLLCRVAWRNVTRRNVIWKKLISSCGARVRTSGQCKNHVGWSIENNLNLKFSSKWFGAIMLVKISQTKQGKTKSNENLKTIEVLKNVTTCNNYKLNVMQGAHKLTSPYNKKLWWKTWCKTKDLNPKS